MQRQKCHSKPQTCVVSLLGGQWLQRRAFFQPNLARSVDVTDELSDASESLRPTSSPAAVLGVKAGLERSLASLKSTESSEVQLK